MQLKDRYAVLKNKYSLPDYETLNREFDLEDINSETEIILAKIRQRMHEKFEFYVRMFESIMQPEASLADMYEAHYLSEHNKKEIYSLFKKMAYFVRFSDAVSVSSREEENAKFINEVFSDWTKTKLLLERHIKTLKESWAKDTDLKEGLENYFG